MSSVAATPGENSVRGTVRYGALLRTGGVKSVVSAMLLARTASQAFSVLIVLFALAEFHSPALAGLIAFFAIAPGLILSPITGALLDRRGTSMVILDYVVSAAIAILIAALSWLQMLPAVLLMILAAAGSITAPLSFSGMRRALPTLLPKPMWSAGFGLDATTNQVAMMIGPVIAGSLIGLGAPQIAMLVLAAAWIAGAFAIAGIEIGERRQSSSSVWVDAKFGMRYIAASPTLRGIAASLIPINLSAGFVFIALPLLVFHLHGSAATVGLLWCANGFSNTIACLVLGKIGLAGREQPTYVLGSSLAVVAILGLALSTNLAAALGAMALLGAASGILNMPVWMMRQRRVEPAVLGRVISISIAVNFIGIPLGAALAGPLAAHSISTTLGLGALLALAGTGLGALLIPATENTTKLQALEA